MRDLRTLPDFDGSIAYAVNGAEQIVGTLLRSGRETHAFVYAGGVMQDLNTLVSQPNVEIVGNGTYRGRRRAFLYRRR